jgi:L-lysine exporter family protein LysE/ArgO
VLALVTGFFTGLSLIVAIGAQNAFVIKQGLKREHVPLIVIICAASDALLILLGTGGLGSLLQRHETLLEFVRWFGVGYLTWFGIKSFRSVFQHKFLETDQHTAPSRKSVALTCMGFTFLNPHVYLDTVIFLGSLANQFEENRWIFASGSAFASIIWFTAIGFGAKAASQYMSKPILWKVLDGFIACIMFALAAALAFYNF